MSEDELIEETVFSLTNGFESEVHLFLFISDFLKKRLLNISDITDSGRRNHCYEIILSETHLRTYSYSSRQKLVKSLTYSGSSFGQHCFNNK